jgi:ribosomal-protein-alanine N-acetyltransferase
VTDGPSSAPAEVVIEPLQDEDDLTAVAELEARCFTNPWTREMLARELANSNAAHVFVLRLGDIRVAAFCACWIVADELHVNTLVVEPTLRRMGLGSRLMRHVMQAAAARGATRATLEVRASNDAALQMYTRLGFTVAAVRRRYYSAPEEDALILWRGPEPAAAPPSS